MGDALPDPVTVEDDPVSVTKSVDTDRFPVDAVSYRIESEQPVTLQLTDVVPESLPLDAVGFHPDFGEEYWETTPDREIQYTRELSADDSVETVFGVRESDVDFERLLSEPDVITQPANNGAADVASSNDGPDTSDASTPAPEPSSEPESTPPAEETDKPASVPEPSAQSQETTTVPESDGESVDTAARLLEQLENGDIDIDDEDSLLGGEPSETESNEPVIERLVTELSADDVDESLKDELRDEVSNTEPRSVDVRIKRLQSTVADLDAYTDALERFLDENGTAQELLDSLDERLETATSDIAALEEQVETVETTVEETTAELDDTTDRVDELEQRLGSDLDDVGEEIDYLHDEIEALREFQQQVENAFAPARADD